MEGEPLIILLVEDNRAHVELIMRSLRDHRMGNTITHLSDGEQAVDYLLRRGEYSDPATSPRPHVILLDLRLPKLDGLDVLKIIKEDREIRRIPVVILTSSEADRDLAAAYDSHVNSYLVKPVDFSKFIDLMNDLGFYWLCWNRKP